MRGIPLHAVARVARASCAYFALNFGAGFVLGAVRVPLLVPRLGVRESELLEMPIMLVVIAVSARIIVKRFDLVHDAWCCIGVGVAAQYVAGRDPISGGVFAVMLCVLAGMPLFVARAHGTSD